MGLFRDNQRQRVYDWETTRLGLLQGDELTLDEVRILVSGAYSFFEMHSYANRVEVKDGRGRRRGCGWLGGVSMPKFTRRTIYTIHEAAHGITDWLYGHNIAGHGPEFVAVYMMLLVKFGSKSFTFLQSTAKEGRVKYANPSSVRHAIRRRGIHFDTQTRPTDVYNCVKAFEGFKPLY